MNASHKFPHVDHIVIFSLDINTVWNEKWQQMVQLIKTGKVQIGTR